MVWKTIKLGDAATFINGYAFKPNDWSTIGLEIIRIQNLTKSSKEVNYYEGLIDEKYKIIKGDLLISWSATLGIYEWIGKDSWLNQHIFKVVFNKKEFDKSFFRHLLSTIIIKLDQEVHGSTMKHITKKRFDNLDIPLPDLSTQQKIANILDKADELRQYNKQLVEKYDALTQSLFLDMFGDPVKNEKKWEKIELKNCTSKIGSGSTPRGGKEAYFTEGISLIRSLNIYDNQFKYKNLAFINDDQAYKLKNVTVEKNDVLFNITGASVCRCTVVPNDVLPARVNQHVSILRPLSKKLNSLFLSRLLISENVKVQLLGVGSAGGAVMEAITKEQLEKFNIPLPPIELQNQFAERVQLIETQKQQAQEALKKSEALFQSLLQKAFKGELN